MTIYQKLVDFDEMFHRLKVPPILLNYLENNSEEEKERINDLITTRYSSDMLSIIPSCQCGETKGEFMIGVVCSACNTPVHSIVNEDIEPLVWFQQPERVSRLINPIVWVMLKNRFKKAGFNVLQWLCDTTYRPKVKQPKVVNDIINIGLQRGYNYFVENFDHVLQTLLSLKEYRLKKNQQDVVVDLIRDFRHIIFSRYLPVPNKSILIIEKTNVRIYIDPNIIGAIDGIRIITSIESPMVDHSDRVKENRTIKAIAKLSEFYEGYFKNSIAGKQGSLRKHVFATRTHFGFRAVVSSLTVAHQYDEIHIPWFVGMTAFRPHLLNKLLKRGYGHNAAIGLLYGHVEKYHSLLEEIFKELIDESPDKCFWVIENRNPSLKQGSAQLKRITRVKPDPADHTVSTSILTVKAPNTDFDGSIAVVKLIKLLETP